MRLSVVSGPPLPTGDEQEIQQVKLFPPMTQGAYFATLSGMPNSDGTKVLTPASFAASISSSCQGKPESETTLTTVSTSARRDDTKQFSVRQSSAA